MSDAVLNTEPLGAPPWPTDDPFLFCVHHLDDYPAGNDECGLDAEHLRGRQLGMDFSGRDGWSLYHGHPIPGFPQHPHRGFETVTLARSGVIDHSDSLGATARFGQGDAQWMTAGRGIVHSEMFPLLQRDSKNLAELFQIWLNLPAKDKLTEPRFTMFWGETVPVIEGEGARVTVVAGDFGGPRPPAPPPGSWAANPEHNVGIATIQLDPGGSWTLPATAEGVNRSVYAFRGEVQADGRTISRTKARLDPQAAVTLTAGDAPAEVLLLQGLPIAEPVAHHGPFVMNTRVELQQAMLDYHQTQFGGWPWPKDGPIHPREKGRFAIHADGREDTPVNDRGS